MDGEKVVGVDLVVVENYREEKKILFNCYNFKVLKNCYKNPLLEI